jgi:S1-C subfamily serine protease
MGSAICQNRPERQRPYHSQVRNVEIVSSYCINGGISTLRQRSIDKQNISLKLFTSYREEKEMKGTKYNHRVTYLVLIVLFATAACLPTPLRQDAATATVPIIPTINTDSGETDDVNKDEIIQAVLAQVEAELAKREKAVSTGYDAPPTTVPENKAESLQETLVHLYEQANPSVVYIVVGTSSTGSGFVYDDSGHIVTNHHVATAGSNYEVVFSNGERQKAELIGSDADSDLAVLKIDALPDGVNPLPLADTDRIQVGQLVVAIGSPFGAEGSMSMGIVSGLGRSLRSQRASSAGSGYTLPEVIQTDAPINPGNSGGPLLNLDGEVIGVNAAIASTSGTNSGVGFSIPVAAVKRIVPSLIEEGEYAYPYMGASFDSEVSLDELPVYDLLQTQGAYVITVEEGGPADQAGLVGANLETGKGGDLIIDIDGRAIGDFSDLNSYLVFYTTVGQTIEITVLRDGGSIVLPLTLGARP